MKSPVEVRCIVCQLIFCCADCRRRHERAEHNLTYDCPICRGKRFLCRPEELNEDFIQHLADEHIPLQCRKCNKVFSDMEDLFDIDKCVTITELLDTECLVQNNNIAETIDDKFDLLFDKVSNNNEGEEFEAIVSINKLNKTAVITPIIRNKHLVDYDSSETESEDISKVDVTRTPHPKVALKTPQLKRQRAATPHAKKFLTLMRQKAFEDYEETLGEEANSIESPLSGTPSGIDRLEVSDSQKEVTTPTSQLPHVLKLAQAVTTSTPTHPATGGWSMFEEHGADSPLSEIETTESPAQSIDKDPKTELDSVQPKLKSIIVTESRLRLGSQDSLDKPASIVEAGNSTDASLKAKKVKFAQDTVFQPEPKVKRVYRKPKRMLTPGPQRPRFCYNPRFQALINRFESQTRTPVQSKLENAPETTPPVGEHNLQARAIDFKEESPAVEVESQSKESNELFSTCIDSPSDPVNNAITMLTANIAGTLQTCLNSVLRTTEEETEIQFKFVITKKKVSVKRIAEDCEGIEEKRSKLDTKSQPNKENIWSSVAKAVKNVFWGDQAPLTPYQSEGKNDSTASSASKRKYEEMSDSDISPLNHKRHKYEGRIRGRPPLRRSKSWGLTGLKPQTIEQSEMTNTMLLNEDTINQSF